MTIRKREVLHKSISAVIIIGGYFLGCVLIGLALISQL